MSQIIPIKELKDTSGISELCHSSSEPIFITKNGYGDMVIMGIEYYDRNFNSFQINGVYSMWELKKKTEPIFKHYGVRRAVLFGSYAKGLATSLSDVDMLVDSGLKGLAFYGLLDELSETLGKRVDLIDVRELESDSEVKSEIKRSGVVIYER